MAAIVAYDIDQFKADVQKYVDTAPVFKEIADLKGLKWPGALVPPALWDTLPHLLELVAAACSAVEVAKQNIIKANDPDGSKGAKFDREIALTTAADIVFGNVKFSGFWGSILNALWRPLINILVSMFVSQQPTDWLVIALKILKLAGVAL